MIEVEFGGTAGSDQRRLPMCPRMEIVIMERFLTGTTEGDVDIARLC